MKKNLLKITLGVAMIAVLGTACKKENEGTPDQKLALNEAKAVIPVNGTEAGAVTNTSASPTSWTAINYNLLNNVASSVGAQVKFESNFNGNITKLTGYSLGYYDSPAVTNVSGITLTDISAVTLGLTTLGSNSATTVGWYDYNRVTRVITPVAKRYAVVANNASVAAATAVYVVQLDAVTATGTTGPFTTNVQFHTKRLK